MLYIYGMLAALFICMITRKPLSSRRRRQPKFKARVEHLPHTKDNVARSIQDFHRRLAQIPAHGRTGFMW